MTFRTLRIDFHQLWSISSKITIFDENSIKEAMHQFNEIHDFASSFIFSTMVFCTGVLQYAFCFVYR